MEKREMAAAVEVAVLARDKSKVEELLGQGGSGSGEEALVRMLAVHLAAAELGFFVRHTGFVALLDALAPLVREPAEQVRSDVVREVAVRTVKTACPELVEASAARAAWVLTLIAAALVDLFTQLNVTGPALDIPERYADRECGLRYLSLEGQTFYPHGVAPFLLAAAQLLFQALDGQLSPLGLRWHMRASMVHQRFLYEPCSRLMTAIEEAGMAFEGIVGDLSLPYGQCSGWHGVLVDYYLEKTLFHQHYDANREAYESIQQACDAAGFAARLTGVVGKKRPDQLKPTAQLMVETSSSVAIDPETRNSAGSEGEAGARSKGKTGVGGGGGPVVVAHDEEAGLLEHVAIADKADKARHEAEVAAITPQQQVILISMCLNVKNNNPLHGLTTEEMLPYIQKVLSKHQNWMVHTAALLQRARLELERPRTIERAVLQMQVLVDQFQDDLGQEEADAAERLQHVYALDYPPLPFLKRELAKRYISIGVAASALAIFEQLHMYEDMATCYIVMDRMEKAEKLLVEMKKKNPTPEILCTLGDVTGEEQHYRDAWDLSNKLCARAQRALGDRRLREEKWARAIDHYELALAINPLFSSTWYRLGCAAMRLQKWELALRGFGRVVHIVDDDGEAYCNMGTVYLQMGEQEGAWRAFQEAAKYQGNNWKIWQNYILVAMNLRKYSYVLLGMRSLMNIGAASRVDLDVMGRLVLLTADGDLDEKTVVAIYDTLTELARLVSSSRVWALHALYHKQRGDVATEAEFRQKEFRAAQISGWEKDGKLFHEIVVSGEELVAVVLKLNQQKLLFSAKLALSRILKLAREYFDHSEDYNRITDLHEQVQSAIAQNKSTT